MIPILNKDLAVIQKLSDLPNSTDGLTAAELKAKFDEAALEIQRWMNQILIPALTAANIPFNATAQLNAQNVQDAVQLVFEQVRDASSGTIVNGAVTREKLAQALLERVFGGRVWISLDKPAATDDPSADFPVGQIWLRPGFSVVNDATNSWNVSGCTASVKDYAVTFTGDSTVAQAEAIMNLSDIGQAGDRVYVLFGIEDKDPEITALTLSLNGGREESVALTSHPVKLSGSSLSLRFRAVWPSTSLATGSFTVKNLAVVNVDAILRQTADCRDMADWASYLEGLLPLDSFCSPRELYIQTNSGVWEQFDHEVFPVHRGGTGVDALASGEMLFGGSSAMEKLAVPQEESVLQFADGRPQWHSGDQLASSLHVLRKAEGSYVGDAVSGREIIFPGAPVLVLIHGDGRYITLMNGQSEQEIYKNEDGISTDTAVSLAGNALVLTHDDYCEVSTRKTLLNKNGVTYTWVAIY